MKCMDPVLCYTNIYTGKRKFRHFSLADGMFKRIHNQVFDCGKCLHCRKKKAYELAMRCVLHASMYKHSMFITLTYDEKKEGYSNVKIYSEIQKFKKRYRQWLYRKTNRRIDIFNVHEYGKNGKKHWHLIVFNDTFPDKTLYTVRNGNVLYTDKKLESLWGYGFVTIGDVSEASAMYQAQYSQKDIQYGHYLSEKKADSKHRGIGKPFFLRHYRQILNLGYIPFGGVRVPIPRSFEKIAHKHWCHFNEKSVFFDTINRKALYRPFAQGQENKEIADLYAAYKERKKERIKELELEWEQVILQHIETKGKTLFQLSGENSHHNLNNKQSLSDF